MRSRHWIAVTILLSGLASETFTESFSFACEIQRQESVDQPSLTHDPRTAARGGKSPAEAKNAPLAARPDVKTDLTAIRDLTLAGSMVQGITWNPDIPADRLNGPVSYNDRANDYQFHQLYTFAEIPARHEGKHFGLGGRVDFLFGSNSRYLVARGLDDQWRTSRLYGFAMPQLYVESALPIAEGLSLKAGKFFGLIGFASDRALDRFFYSFPNISYAEPATHTGMLASFRPNNSWTLRAGLTRGWDNWEDNNDKLAFTGAVDWKSCDEQTSVVFAFHTGPEDDAGLNNRYVHSFLVEQRLSQRVTCVLHHDLFWEDDGVASPQDADGYGIRTQLIYQASSTLGTGIRLEWFRDDDGVIVTPVDSDVNPGAGNYYSLTLAVDWKPSQYLTLRPEARWDWTSGGIKPFDDASAPHQFLLGLQAIYRLW